MKALECFLMAWDCTPSLSKDVSEPSLMTLLKVKILRFWRVRVLCICTSSIENADWTSGNSAKHCSRSHIIGLEASTSVPHDSSRRKTCSYSYSFNISYILVSTPQPRSPLAQRLHPSPLPLPVPQPPRSQVMGPQQEHPSPSSSAQPWHSSSQTHTDPNAPLPP